MWAAAHTRLGRCPKPPAFHGAWGRWPQEAGGVRGAAPCRAKPRACLDRIGTRPSCRLLGSLATLVLGDRHLALRRIAPARRLEDAAFMLAAHNAGAGFFPRPCPFHRLAQLAFGMGSAARYESRKGRASSGLPGRMVAQIDTPAQFVRAVRQGTVDVEFVTQNDPSPLDRKWRRGPAIHERGRDLGHRVSCLPGQ